MAFSTEERKDALARLRRKRGRIIRQKPHWVTAIKDAAIQIDALESLIIVDLERISHGKKKGETKKTQES